MACDIRLEEYMKDYFSIIFVRETVIDTTGTCHTPFGNATVGVQQRF